MSNWITLDTAHGPVKVWHAAPAGTPKGGLVIIQEIFGVTPHIREVAAGYAAEGYEVLAPAFFDPVRKDTELAYDADGVKQGLELVGELGMERALDIVSAAAAKLVGAGKIGTVGYCWGGTVAMLSAVRLGLPSASYYGGRNAQYLDETPRAPVIFHFGQDDASIPMETVEQHRQRLPQMATWVYPAGHAFNRAGDPHYHAESARLALERTLAFFSENLR